MSISIKLVCFICLMSIMTTYSWASCSRVETTPTYELYTNLERVVVSPDIPRGGVIRSKKWTMDYDGKIYYKCTKGDYDFVAKIVYPGVQDLGNKIYSTNIQGIGLRFSRQSGSTINMIYPDTYPLKVNDNTNITLGGSEFTMEVIKTEDVTGSGTLNAGKYTSYDWSQGNNPVLETYIRANAITIVSPSCTILSGKNMNIDVGTIKINELNGVGTTAGGTDFNIKLQCSGGVTESGYAYVNTSFSGTLATGTTATSGVLINEKNGTSMAKGVGIQVLMDGTPIEFGEKYNIAKLQANEMRGITIPLKARFFQYADNKSTGEVESHMIFNITYD